MVGRKEWAADDVLSAADLEGYLMDQAVTIWANASARNSGILAPIAGQICYLQDSSSFQAYNGSAWVAQVSLAGTPAVATSADTLNGRTVFVQSATPTALATGDLWFW